MRIHRSFSLLVAGIQAIPATAAVAIVLNTNEPSRFQITTADTLFVNKKEEVRVWPEGGASKVAPNQAGKLRAQPLRGNYVLRKFAEGAFQLKLGGESAWTSVIPEGATEKTDLSGAEFWKNAALSAGKERQAKTATDLDASQIVLVISAPTLGEALDRLVWEPDATTLPGRAEAQIFAERLAFLVSAAKSIPAEAAVDAWRARIGGITQVLLRDWARGGAPSDVMDLADTWLTAATQAFPADTSLRAQVAKLAEERANLLKQRTLLAALAAGEQYDPFLFAYREFEPYQRSFADLQTQRRDSYRKSARLHFLNGKLQFEMGDYATARDELALASVRSPALDGLEPLAEEARLAWAKQKMAENARIPRGDPMARTHVEANRRIQTADRLIGAGQIDQAEQELAAAAAQEPSNIGVELMRAKISAARHLYRGALAQLDDYYTHCATVDEFNAAEKLRNDILFDLKDLNAKTHPQLDALTKANRYQSAIKAANASLSQDPEDADALFTAGVSAAVTRNEQSAKESLRHFLAASDSEAASPERRLLAIQILRSLGTAAAPPAPAKSGARS